MKATVRLWTAGQQAAPGLQDDIAGIHPGPDGFHLVVLPAESAMAEWLIRTEGHAPTLLTIDQADGRRWSGVLTTWELKSTSECSHCNTKVLEVMAEPARVVTSGDTVLSVVSARHHDEAWDSFKRDLVRRLDGLHSQGGG